MLNRNAQRLQNLTRVWQKGNFYIENFVTVRNCVRPFDATYLYGMKLFTRTDAPLANFFEATMD